METINKGIFNKNDILKHVTLDGVRIHLKTDEKKLWINSQYVLYLNDSANMLLENFIDSCYEVNINLVIKRTVDKIKMKYLFMSREIIEKDLQNLLGIINSLARNEIPVNIVGMTVADSKDIRAPNRMDISLTYRCNNRCPHCYLDKNEDASVLTTEQWKQIIDKLWSVGIPQLVFSGGECTLREDLPELIEYSKKFITGIISNGTNFTLELANKLKKAELDWVQITLDASKKDIHDIMQGRSGAYDETINGIKNCVAAGLQVAINMTVTQKNKEDIFALIELADKLGVKLVSTNALINSGRGINKKYEDAIDEKELSIIIKEAQEYASNIGITFNWYLPTCYNYFNPIKLGFGQRCCSACSVNMMIEPTGEVIPCQSWTQLKLGNILKDSWDSIWNNPEAIKIRNFGYAPKECRGCDHFSKCGGGCPLEQLNVVKRCGK